MEKKEFKGYTLKELAAERRRVSERADHDKELIRAHFRAFTSGAQSTAVISLTKAVSSMNYFDYAFVAFKATKKISRWIKAFRAKRKAE